MKICTKRGVTVYISLKNLILFFKKATLIIFYFLNELPYKKHCHKLYTTQ